MKTVVSLLLLGCLSTAAYGQVEILAAGAAGSAAGGTAAGGAAGTGTAGASSVGAAAAGAPSAAEKAQQLEEAEEKAFEKSKKRWEFLKTFLGDIKTMIKEWSPAPITTKDMLEEMKSAKELMPTLPEAKRTESPVKPAGVNGLMSRAESSSARPTSVPETFDEVPTAPTAPKRAELLKGRRDQPVVQLPN